MKAVCRRLLIDGSPSTFWHCFLGLCLLRTVSRPCYTSGVGGIQLALQLSSPSVPGGSAASSIHSISLLLQSSPGTASCNSHASAFRRGEVLTGHILCRGMHINIQALARRVACCSGSAWRFLDSYILVLGRVCARQFCVFWTYCAQAHTHVPYEYFKSICMCIQQKLWDSWTQEAPRASTSISRPIPPVSSSLCVTGSVLALFWLVRNFPCIKCTWLELHVSASRNMWRCLEISIHREN